MKPYLSLLLMIFIVGCSSQQSVSAVQQPNNIAKPDIVKNHRWAHGSADCKNNKQPVYDIYKHDDVSFILRQNKCLTYEAPFIYVLVGTEKILVLDTGALDGNESHSLYSVIEDILGKQQLANKSLLVLHSHSHKDHYLGDSYFNGRDNVQLIDTSAEQISKFFGFSKSTDSQTTLELGDRKVTAIATPGHQEEAITLYDSKTKWLLTGDTLYPGYIYIKDWQAYRKSIARLAKFSKQHSISAIMGAHIEMKQEQSVYYPYWLNLPTK